MSPRSPPVAPLGRPCWHVRATSPLDVLLTSPQHMQATSPKHRGGPSMCSSHRHNACSRCDLNTSWEPLEESHVVPTCVTNVFQYNVALLLCSLICYVMLMLCYALILSLKYIIISISYLYTNRKLTF